MYLRPHGSSLPPSESQPLLDAEVVLGEGQDEVQFAAAVAHQLGEEEVSAAAGTAIPDVGLQLVQLDADGLADGVLQGRVGGEADGVARSVQPAAGEDDHGAAVEQAQQVLADGQVVADQAQLTMHGGDVAVAASRAGQADRLGIIRAGGVRIPQQQGRLGESGQLPVIGLAAGLVDFGAHGVANLGGERARLFGVTGEEGEGGGVDAGKRIGSEFVGLAVEVEAFAVAGGASGGVRQAAGLILADAAGEAEGVAAKAGRQVGMME